MFLDFREITLFKQVSTKILRKTYQSSTRPYLFVKKIIIVKSIMSHYRFVHNQWVDLQMCFASAHPVYIYILSISLGFIISYLLLTNSLPLLSQGLLWSL